MTAHMRPEMDSLVERMRRTHHSVRTEVHGRWLVARPLRSPSRWRQWRGDVTCRKQFGHCWHAEPDTWTVEFCCMCSAESESLPAEACIFCQVTR